MLFLSRFLSVDEPKVTGIVCGPYMFYTNIRTRAIHKNLVMDLTVTRALGPQSKHSYIFVAKKIHCIMPLAILHVGSIFISGMDNEDIISLHPYIWLAMLIPHQLTVKLVRFAGQSARLHFCVDETLVPITQYGTVVTIMRGAEVYCNFIFYGNS